MLARAMTLTALVGVLASTSCTTTQVSPAFYRARTVAVVALHGNQLVEGVDPLAGIGANTLGDSVLLDVEGGVIQRVAQAMQARVLDVEEVAMAEGYDALPAWTLERATVPPLRPLSTDVASEAGLAELAQTLAVDAVVAARFHWSIEAATEGANTGASNCVAALELVVVSDQGERLWRQQTFGEAPLALSTTIDGAVNIDDLTDALVRASRAAVERFFGAVVKNRPNRAIAG